MSDAFYLGASGDRYAAHVVKSRTEFVQRIASRVFLPFANPQMTIVDFGCGNGGVLSILPATRRIGIEIHAPSAAEASHKGIDAYASTDCLPDQVADLAISHHALEHVQNPHAVLCELFRILKPGGRLVLALPSEPRRQRWHLTLDRHLYSWNPRTISALVTDCGFTIEGSWVMAAGASRYIRWLEPVQPLFDLAAFALAHTLNRFQLMCVAYK